MNHRGISLLEVTVAMGVLALCLVPVMQMVGTSSQAVKKSQNLRFAASLAHKIAQHLLSMPYDEIVDTPELVIAGGPADGIFNPFSNPGTTQASALQLTEAHLPELAAVFRKFNFRYQLQVSGTQPKDVEIRIRWDESSRILEYPLRVYVARH